MDEVTVQDIEEVMRLRASVGNNWQTIATSIGSSYMTKQICSNLWHKGLTNLPRFVDDDKKRVPLKKCIDENGNWLNMHGPNWEDYRHPTLNSVEIIVKSSTQLRDIQQILEGNNLIVEDAHIVDNDNDNDFFQMHGHNNNSEGSDDDDDDEEEEEEEDNDTLVANYIIKLPTLDALRAVVLLNAGVEGSNFCSADFAYNKKIGY